MFRVCHVLLSVHCSLVVTCWERADLLALLHVMFYCVLVTLPCGVLGQMCCLIVSIPDLCLLSYFIMFYVTCTVIFVIFFHMFVEVKALHGVCLYAYHIRR